MEVISVTHVLKEVELSFPLVLTSNTGRDDAEILECVLLIQHNLTYLD